MPPGPIFNGVYDVKVYGAHGDGINPDATFIQSALDAASDAGGGTVYFPPGQYLLETAILADSETVLQGNPGGTASGDSSATSILVAENNIGGGNLNLANILIANKDFQRSPWPGHLWKDNITVRDLTLNGNAKGNSRANGNAAIYFQGVKNVRIERCGVFSCANHGISVVSTTQADTDRQGNVWIRDNILDILPTRALAQPHELLSGNIVIRCQALNSVTIEGNVIGANGPSSWIPTWSNDAIDCPTCSQVVVRRNLIQWATDGVGSNNSSDAIVVDNIVQNCIGDGISSFASEGSGVSYYTVARNVIISAFNPPLGLGPMAFALRAVSANQDDPSPYVTYSDNICFGPFRGGAIDVEVSNATVCGNQIDCQGNATGGPYNSSGIVIKESACTVRFNTIRNQTGTSGAAAIVISGSPLKGLVVTGNNIDDSNVTPINITTLPQESLIVDNSGISTYGTIIQPSVTVNAPFSNPFPFDCSVYLTPGSAPIMSVSVDGVLTSYSSTLNGTAMCPFKVKQDGSIDVQIGSGSSPSWAWIPD
jgi:Pectate lyase superfamily protein